MEFAVRFLVVLTMVAFEAVEFVVAFLVLELVVGLADLRHFLVVLHQNKIWEARLVQLCLTEVRYMDFQMKMAYHESNMLKYHVVEHPLQ